MRDIDKTKGNSRYQQLLQTNEWKKKRLSVLERDNFKCRQCGQKNFNLQVHHTLYIEGRKPWEYLKKYLITLCGTCHQQEHDTVEIKVLKKAPEKKVSKPTSNKKIKVANHLKKKKIADNNKRKVKLANAFPEARIPEWRKQQKLTQNE